MAKVLREIEVCDVCEKHPVVEPAVLTIGRYAGGEDQSRLNDVSSYYPAVVLCQKHQELFNKHLLYNDDYFYDSGNFDKLKEKTVEKLKEIEENE